MISTVLRSLFGSFVHGTPPAQPVGSAKKNEPVTQIKATDDVFLVVPPDALDVLGDNPLTVDMARRHREPSRKSL